MLYFFGNVFSAHGSTLSEKKTWKRNGHGAECTAAKGGDASSSSALARGLDFFLSGDAESSGILVLVPKISDILGTQIFTAI